MRLTNCQRNTSIIGMEMKEKYSMKIYECFGEKKAYCTNIDSITWDSKKLCQKIWFEHLSIEIDLIVFARWNDPLHNEDNNKTSH